MMALLLQRSSSCLINDTTYHYTSAEVVDNDEVEGPNESHYSPRLSFTIAITGIPLSASPTTTPSTTTSSTASWWTTTTFLASYACCASNDTTTWIIDDDDLDDIRDSLRLRTMATTTTTTTAAAAANATDAEKVVNNGDDSSQAPKVTTTTAASTSSVHHLAQRALDVTASSWQQWMTPRYALPNKAVASQVLMYRQLLHTACRPGLKLSRDYQGTPAQRAVLNMPWWEQGIEETRKMVISYDNLMSRLWYHGAIWPFESAETAADMVKTIPSGPPPIPHEYWVDRLGFQQPDPVTDFRSGGVLSLAMMVFMVESCADVVQRFLKEDSVDRIVLPFAITCINITDMLAKFLMLSKSVAQMDALLSQKPFWRMFDDPQSILALQEISMTFLCDVVNELQQERLAAAAAAIALQEQQQQQQAKSKAAGTTSVVRKLLWQGKSAQPEQQPTDDAENNSNDQPSGDESEPPPQQEIPDTKVTVFDFSLIMERTERRIRDDLLGAGPRSVPELRALAEKLQGKYKSQLDRRIAPPSTSTLFKSSSATPSVEDVVATSSGDKDDANVNTGTTAATGEGSWIKAPTLRLGGGVGAGALWNKVKSTTTGAAATVVAKIRTTPSPSGSASGDATLPPDLISGDDIHVGTAAKTTPTGKSSELQDWEGTDMSSPSDSIKHFSISDEEDDDML